MTPSRAHALRAGALVLSAPLVVAATFGSGVALALPLGAGTLAWLYLWRGGARSRPLAIAALLAWAATLSLSVVVATRAAPERAGELVLNGERYWEEMRPFVLEGRGKETEPARFVPEHLIHLGAFALLAVGTGGWAALALGAFLLAYMSYYVAQVSLLAQSPWLAGALAWHPWAVLRVVAFVILGVCLARPLLERIRPLSAWREDRHLLATAGVLWVCDLTLKSLAAPAWSTLIRELGGIS